MRLRFRILKWIMDILILTLGLLFIFGQTHRGQEISFLQLDGLPIFGVVCLTYLISVAIVEFLLIYMQQGTTAMRLIKMVVSMLLMVTIFPFVLWFGLWLAGYTIEGDVAAILITIGAFRGFFAVIIMRLAKRGGEAVV